MNHFRLPGAKCMRMLLTIVLSFAMLPSAAFASDFDSINSLSASEECAFESATISKSQATGGDTIVVTVSIKDPSVVKECSISYRKPIDGRFEEHKLTMQDNGLFTCSISILPTTQAGEWTVERIRISDSTHSWSVANLSYKGDYRFDLSKASYRVYGTCSDTQAPKLRGVCSLPKSVVAGNDVSVEVNASDDSGIQMCAMAFVRPSGKYEILYLSEEGSGVFRTRLTVSENDVGFWTAAEIEMIDNVGNVFHAYGGEIDLTSADFEVVPSETDKGNESLAENDILKSFVKWPQNYFDYTGSPICPEPEVTLNGDALVEGVDYEISYENNIDPGEATAIIRGMGRFSGTKTVSFSIRRSVPIPESKSFAYSGHEIHAYANDEHISVIPDGDSAATNAGKYEARIKLADPSKEMWEDETIDDKIIDWEIAPADFSEVDISGIEPSYKYTGSTIEPNFECSYGGVSLVEGTDYEVSYSDNTEPGVATVLVVGKGNFKGNRELHFNIEGREVNSAIKSNRENLIKIVTEESGSSSEEPSVSYGNLSQNNYRYTFSCGDGEFGASYTVKDSGWTKAIGIRYDYRTDLVSVSFQQVKSGNYYAANAVFFAVDYRTSSDVSFKDASGSGSLSISYAEKFLPIAISRINSCMIKRLGSSLCKIGFTSYSHSHEGGNATCVEKAECDICGQKYGDFGEHKGGNATCTEEARCDICGQKYGSCAPHSIETVGIKNNSFEEEGYTGDQVCSVCGYVEHSGETIPRKTKPGTDTVKGLVANGIIDKGSYDENGNPFIGSTTRSDGTVCTSRILFNGDTGLFELWCGVYDDSSAVTLAISPFSSSAAAATAYLSVALRGAGSFDAVASITPASYRDGMSLYFNIVSQDIVGSNIDNERVQELCNAYLQAAFPGWDLALLNKFGLYANMADLGFSSYEQPGYGIRDISNASVALYSKVYTYNGAPHCPAASVQYDGCELVDGVDYEVEYLNNTEIGFATVRVRGKGFYKGLTDEIFSIAPYGTWQSDNGRWWYQHYDGSYTANGWEQIDGSWYRFDADGWMQTGWILDGSWYYLDGSGAMVTGWKSVGGAWYYLADSGAMKTGWYIVDDSWYYSNGSGAMLTGWLNSGGAWYYLSGSGSMATGWRLIGGTWYWFENSGVMATGWRLIDSDYYYFDGSGAMQSSKWIGDYYLTSSGAMAKDQWVGSYHVGHDGRWDATA